jgi:hypothetical protein
VDEFTIGPIRTPRELDLACGFLLGFFPSLEAGWRGPGFFQERLAGESPMMLGLLSALERGARSLGVRRLTLGSIEGAVDFYERCGYQGRLLVQFVPPARRDEVAPLFADFALLETQWQDVSQPSG